MRIRVLPFKTKSIRRLVHLVSQCVEITLWSLSHYAGALRPRPFRMYSGRRVGLGGWGDGLLLLLVAGFCFLPSIDFSAVLPPTRHSLRALDFREFLDGIEGFFEYLAQGLDLGEGRHSSLPPQRPVARSRPRASEANPTSSHGLGLLLASPKRNLAAGSTLLGTQGSLESNRKPFAMKLLTPLATMS